MYGNIFEGTVTPDGKMNGFCISFIGGCDCIDVGWYRDNKMNGNWMSFKAFKNDIVFKESGWYEGGQRVGPMKDDDVYKKFLVEDIFAPISISYDDKI